MPRRVLHDEFFKKAKAEGYLARSAYKLKEIQERRRLFGPGSRVLDLGCAPGAWVQVALEAVGPRGVVVGIDLKEVRENFGPNAFILQGDVYATPAATLLGQSGMKFDAVLSDMAPDTTGHGDHFLSVRLCRRVLELLPSLLKPGGNLAMKVFEGEEYPALLKETSRMFASAKGFKPKASRDVSREMYIIGERYRPPGQPRQETISPDGADTAPPRSP
ncbi:MAG: RlmE family RNA methyltransferase [Phycisphaeraceae bacterium]|nr:RlmE family RNA methyltransferase [Phycisphaeraceae bacterium]